MLRELIAWVLNNYLGKYVENLNTAQLTIALLSGEVELENLPLRKDALRYLGLPLQVVRGSVGKIKLQVPVRQFRTASWCINIENVNVVCGPVDLKDWSPEVEHQSELDFKLANLDRLEAKWRAQRETANVDSSYYASSYSGWLSYGTSLVTNIIENLQLKINGIHIRYEDSITIPNQCFACGVNIEALSAQSCDANWIPGLTSNWSQNQATYKIVELQKFSFYWDPLVTHLELHDFIINPISAKAQFKRDRSETPLRTRNRPRLVCDLLWDEISITLSDIQYNQMVGCFKGLDEIARNRRYKLLRPDNSVNENPKAWWLYAIRCHGLMMYKHRDPYVIAKENMKYVQVYTKVIINPNEVLSSDNKAFKDKVERERDYEELKLLRDLCMMNVPSMDKQTKTNPTNQGKNMLVHFFPQWWGWYNNNNVTPNESEMLDEQWVEDQDLSPSPFKDANGFEDEILNALADSVENNSLLKRDAVFGKFSFSLQKGTMDICSGLEKTPMLQFQFKDLLLNIESRPRSGSHFVGLSLGSILIKDRITSNSEFPDLIKPQTKEDNMARPRNPNQKTKSTANTSIQTLEPLFLLQYERKPLSYDTDYRLMVKSQSLDIVYNTEALKWLIDFLTKPHQLNDASSRIEDMKHKTKMELIKNWESILEGHLNARKTWTLEFDIFAPQIIFVENFADRNNSSVVVIDFGRLQLTNGYKMLADSQNKASNVECTSPDSYSQTEEDDAFMTPCSTPPGSEASTTNSPTLASAFSELPEISTINMDTLDEFALYEKLYDRYHINLTDLQVLVCRGKERWNFASLKGTSTLHVLDRFNITLQVERRVVYTSDPRYPSLTLSGTLPKLNAHINEHKISSLISLSNIFLKTNNKHFETLNPPTSESTTKEADDLSESESDDQRKESSKIIVLQFSIDQMSLELQSRGRSIAELQVTGVKAGFSQRPEDTSLTLSVHGLLLVDAMQSFGPDFELLIASHRHVGMDSLSGSLRQSEPCSPCSPGSPDPNTELKRPTSPLTISKALSNLQRANYPIWDAAPMGDLDALITVEVIFVHQGKTAEILQVANIQFNNLDIIANQETIVELLGFVKRVIPKITDKRPAPKEDQIDSNLENIKEENCGNIGENTRTQSTIIRTEITFDFHRLNILILRALMRDNYLVGRKVGTFTMSEAKIHATLGASIAVEGSLGGLQILDLTPEGVNHQRILSVGKDPLTEPPEPAAGTDLYAYLTQELYGTGSKQNAGELHEERQALSFCVSRDLNTCVDVRIKMASVWFIHCARFMQELSWCATEFKNYFKNLARSIRDKATDMALGLVQSRADSFTAPRSTDFAISSPSRRARRTRTISFSKAQEILIPTKLDIRLDITLDTPVLILPRSSCSPQVLVAHLGKISITNNDKDITEDLEIPSEIVVDSDYDKNADYNLSDLDGLFEMEEDAESSVTFKETDNIIDNLDTYSIDIRNINLYSLDTSNRKGFKFSALPRAEDFYSCKDNAIPIIHDTAIRLEISRDVLNTEFKGNDDGSNNNILKVIGCVVRPLRLSMKRQQYEQLLETIDNIFKIPKDLIRPPSDIPVVEKLTDINEESNFHTFSVNEKIRRRLYYQGSLEDKRSTLNPYVHFELPSFVIQLNDNKDEPLIQISFLDFNVDYEMKNMYETNVKVSLRSLLMEDLLRPDSSKDRIMVISSSQESQAGRPTSSFSSRSCPNLVGLLTNSEELPNSLPNNLENKSGYFFLQTNNKTFCPDTPPPSPLLNRPQQENLVIYSSVLINPSCPTFATQYKSMSQSSSIDFNSLDLVISVQSWFVLLNFFGLLTDDDNSVSSQKTVNQQAAENEVPVGNSELEISVRSLTLVLAKPDYEIAKANVSNAHFIVSKHGHAKTVEGRLGVISLSDLTAYGNVYREKFMTSGNEALNFIYIRDTAKSNARTLQKDARLKIHMSSVRYVHTKRFIAEIQLFFKEFSQLQTPVMRKIKPSDSRLDLNQRPTQLGLEIKAASPIILLPLSSTSDEIIVADLGEFTLKNNFKMSTDGGLISISNNRDSSEVLDVMLVHLLHTDLFAARRQSKNIAVDDKNTQIIDMKNYNLVKKGDSLLKEKCHLKLQVERNMDTWKSHNVPDISVHGTFSKLEAVIDLQQYKLVRGFLTYNLGEPIDDLYMTPMYIPHSSLSLNTESDIGEEVWKMLSINLELQDVSVCLELAPIEADSQPSSLACINFIKSKLLVDSFSDGAQDIDLVSQEILVTDTRFINNAAKIQTKNVFPNILKPINFEPGTDSVQAEIHSRKRKDSTKFTILLNNMRLMAILDWLESVRDFILQTEEQPIATLKMPNEKSFSDMNQSASPQPEYHMELKLNITDSELVFVEKTDQWDTNAVILKSTTVVSYRPSEINKVMSINLNHLEVFSCVLGSEEDTALSIIDPVTVNMDIRRGVLEVQMQKQLCVRLSYHDVKMFQQMMMSLPEQTKNARDNKMSDTDTAGNKTAVAKLQLLGFKMSDCLIALEKCDNQIDDAALWLTQNSEPMRHCQSSRVGSLDIVAFELKAPCISICIIDDCKDADVPFIEVSLSKLDLRQELGQNSITEMNMESETTAIVPGQLGTFKVGHLSGVFASDYYNRALSGWEPLIEPWKLEANWSYSLGQTGNRRNRLHLRIESADTLRLNITSTLIELYKLVRDNWIQDYYSSSPPIGSSKGNLSPTGYKRRTPFIPFAIKNDTGVKLYYTTLISSGATPRAGIPQSTWNVIEPGSIGTFSYGPQSKQRHHDTHKLNLHQIAVRIDGWQEVGPISIDRVGIYFRHARSDVNEDYSTAPRARIVFAVTLEGSAQKLVTVRSALKIVNKLENPVLVKMEHLYGHLNIRDWPDSKTQILCANDILNIPLSHVHAFLFIRPLNSVIYFDESKIKTGDSQNDLPKFDGNDYWNKFEKLEPQRSFNSTNNYQFTDRSIHWKDAVECNEIYQDIKTCRGNRDNSYKMIVMTKKEGYPSKDTILLPGHTITLWPPLRLHNLLPCDLLYKFPSGTKGRISSSNTININEIDMEQPLELTVTIDSYPIAGQICVSLGFFGITEIDIKLFDTKNRLLKLRASISITKGCGIQISISAPYWLVNRTGLPLVFRQDDVDTECAGQYTENEQARMISPFMFSFSDPNVSASLTMRLGKRFGMHSNWCQPFKLESGIKHRQLAASLNNETFILGIEIRRGRGRYSQTSVVTFSPRFQLYNRSSYKLQFSQKCFATTLSDPTARSTFIEAVSGCHIPFHWPRLDKDQELCVRLPDVADCLWSGGIPIHETQSLYVNIRNLNGVMHFLRLEIILQGAIYFMLFGDAQVLPPPIRLDNYSEVPIKFHQPGTKHLFKSLVRPHTSIAYVLDEPLGSKYIQLEAPGGDAYNCPINGFDDIRLTYENFIYIALSQTFECSTSFDRGGVADFDVRSQQLVLGVVENRVVLVRKQAGDRSQLWRMNHEKQLEHEGSSPPSEPGKKHPRFVLDLEKPPQPTQYINLIVRPANKQRRSTQTWYFTEDGRLMCEHSNMCVQARGGFFGLRSGSDAVLGMIISDTKVLNNHGVPFEQAIERQKLRPGSGCLSVSYRMDGPIKAFQIKDVKSSATTLLTLDSSWKHVSHILSDFAENSNANCQLDKCSSIEEYHVDLKLQKGLGISLISNAPCEELAYIALENINMEMISTPSVRSLDFSVGDMQIDNQLSETTCPITMYTIKHISAGDTPSRSALSSLQLNVKLLPSPNTNAIIFEHFLLSIRPIAVYLEERLILRLAKFSGLAKSHTDPAALPDESDYEAQKVVSKILAANAKRYYFGDLQIVPSQIRLSFITASKLSPIMNEIKKNLGYTFIKFEDALINFEKFTHKHNFETMDAYMNAIKTHYKQELKWQAASILGSVDFLGNPLGFANDLSEGVSGLLFEGSISSLVKNVTHGISNSTAKLTETLSDGLGKVVFDDQHVEARQKILDISGGTGSTTGDHLVAGFKGFTFGLLGGVTSIVKHTYQGTANEGFSGFFTGLGKGIVGTVTKPVIGVLDLASETANAVREQSKSSNRTLPLRKRLPRTVTGAPGGLLPPYSTLQAKGQQHLFLINKRNFSEQFMAYEPCLLDSKDSKMRLLVSAENIWGFSRNEDSTTIVFNYHLSELISCHPVVSNNPDNPKSRKMHYIELCLSLPSKSLTPSAPEMVKRPRVRCQNEEIAKKVSLYINFAKCIYDEREQTLNSDTVID